MKVYGLIAWFGLTLAQVSYEGQQLLECQVPNKVVADKLYDYDVFSHNKDVFAVRVLNEQQKQEVNAITKCTVKVDDLSKQFTNTYKKKLVRRGNPRCPSALPDDKFFADYQSYRTIKTQFKHWAKKYPQYATFIPSIGKSIEGRDIFAIEITNQISRLPKKDIIYVGGQHAREWIAPASVSYITNRLLVDADNNDKQVSEHLSRFAYRIVPLANPDGYEYTRTNDRLWRKNRRHNYDGSFGVDLNRNWDDHWGVVGSKSNTTAPTYHGTGPHSEPEVEAIAKYIDSFPNRYGGIDWHAYKQLILRNWGWNQTPSKNEPILKKMGDSVRDAFNAHGYSFTSGRSAGLYPAAGALDDYMATKGKLVSLTVELCPDDDSIGFELPPAQLLKCAQAAYSGSKQFSEFLLENPNIPPNEFN